MITTKTQWLAALRSGDYTQGSGQLANTLHAGRETPISYCCLGVLADLEGILGPKVDVEKPKSYMDGLLYMLDSKLEEFLSTLNDSTSDQFASVAAWIEVLVDEDIEMNTQSFLTSVLDLWPDKEEAGTIDPSEFYLPVRNLLRMLLPATAGAQGDLEVVMSSIEYLYADDLIDFLDAKGRLDES